MNQNVSFMNSQVPLAQAKINLPTTCCKRRCNHAWATAAGKREEEKVSLGNTGKKGSTSIYMYVYIKTHIAGSSVVGHVKGGSHLGLSTTLVHANVRVHIIEDGILAHEEQLPTHTFLSTEI
jgi:hypothetical protein